LKRFSSGRSRPEILTQGLRHLAKLEEMKIAEEAKDARGPRARGARGDAKEQGEKIEKLIATEIRADLRKYYGDERRRPAPLAHLRTTAQSHTASEGRQAESMRRRLIPKER